MNTPALLVAAALALAALAAVVVRLVTERRALVQQLAQLEHQGEIGRVLLTDRNIRGVTHHVAESAAQLLGCELALVTLTTEQPSRLVIEAATGPLAMLVGAAVPAEDSLPGWVVARREPQVLNDPDDEGGVPFRPVVERVPIRRALMLPLNAGGRCVGALGVLNPRDGRRFDEGDIAQLQALAEYAALNVEAIRAIEALREREHHAALLNRISSRIRQSLEIGVILDAAVRELGLALGVSRCYVRLRRGADLEPPACEWHAADVQPLGERQDPAAPLIVRAFRERRTVETPDAREVPAVNVSGPALLEPLAVLVAPVVLRGETAGVLAFHQKGLPRLWRAGEIALVEAVAGELAVAIQNARLYRSVEAASRELAAKIAELERVDRAKAQFLANMSHELRTPLNSVIGFSDFLLQGGQGTVSREQRDALEIIARNGRHLLDLVNDVLDLAKVDAGRMDLDLQPVDLRQVIPQVISGLDNLVQTKGHRIQLALGDRPLTVRADETRARQVFVNLLSNAVKFTPPGGGIVLEALRRRSLLPLGPEHKEERDVVLVSVTDTGIGIAAEDQPRLFSEFTQLDGSLGRHYEGTGLGLALCKRLMDLHGGRIGVDSTPGRGSRFWVEFPVGGPPSAAAA